MQFHAMKNDKDQPELAQEVIHLLTHQREAIGTIQDSSQVHGLNLIWLFYCTI